MNFHIIQRISNKTNFLEPTNLPVIRNLLYMIFQWILINRTDRNCSLYSKFVTAIVIQNFTVYSPAVVNRLLSSRAFTNLPDVAANPVFLRQCIKHSKIISWVFCFGLSMMMDSTSLWVTDCFKLPKKGRKWLTGMTYAIFWKRRSRSEMQNERVLRHYMNIVMKIWIWIYYGELLTSYALKTFVRTLLPLLIILDRRKSIFFRILKNCEEEV